MFDDAPLVLIERRDLGDDLGPHEAVRRLLARRGHGPT
jgi:hypothetical protein